jgi:methylated-DNA-[protein]-cysteine S-methyltransferase
MQLAAAETVASRRVGRYVSDGLAAVSFDTELDWMALAFQEDVLAGVVFGHPSQQKAREALERYVAQGRDQTKVVDFQAEDELPVPIVDLVDRLKSYAAGKVVDFGDVRIDDRHLTPFGRKITSACRQIARGGTKTYGELATRCGSPGAARAVGQVMARNRYPLVVPCHRVLAAGGVLGGFSAPQGLTMKRRLLALERLR